VRLIAEVQESLGDPPGPRRSGGLDRTRDARDSILLLSLSRSFRYGDGGRSTEHDRMSADDSALRECHESRGTRYSERHSAQKDAPASRMGRASGHLR
jgi:hypothetical protein